MLPHWLTVIAGNQPDFSAVCRPADQARNPLRFTYRRGFAKMAECHICTQDLNAWYHDEHALKNITVEIPPRGITAIIGPSGCGKSTLLKSLNRLLEETEGVRVTGQVLIDGANIYGPGVDVTGIRTRIGMLAPKPFPLPMSIFDNVAYGPRIHRERLLRDEAWGGKVPRSRSVRQAKIHDLVEATAGRRPVDEVKDRLRSPASRLSTGRISGYAWLGSGRRARGAAVRRANIGSIRSRRSGSRRSFRS